MKSVCWPPTVLIAAFLLLVASVQLRAQPESRSVSAQPDSRAINQVTLTTVLSPEIKPVRVLEAMQRVANWQLANPAKERATDWVPSAGDAGMMALAGISGDPKYRDAMLAMGETNDWKLGARLYDADDHCVGQTYAELYLLYREPKMIAPMRERFDAILAKPSEVQSLEYTRPQGKGRENWSWCDAMFMGPPTWLRLYAATGDERYLNFAVTNWWRTTDYLYETNEHLFFRDNTYFEKREANGKKVFWSRGNGWVLAGLVRTLQYLPMNGVAATPSSQAGVGDGASPLRARLEKLFKDMAEKVLTCQQPDGLWRSSLLDPGSYPAKETSGSGFFTYALAWGVNQGLLDRAKFEPAVRKGWAALVACVNADGKLTHVQPVGSDPKNFDANSTEPYGVGAFLLAGSEIYRLAALAQVVPGSLKDNPIYPHQTVIVSNPSQFERSCETVEIDLKANPFNFDPPNIPSIEIAAKHIPSYEFAVMDGVSSRILDSQVYSPDSPKPSAKLLFQVDLAPGETRLFYIFLNRDFYLASVPPPIVKTFARYVPERHDDFAWESDRIAHRVFGKALETWQEEPLTSSGYDVWVKRTRNLVINDMYRTMNLFETNGPSQDDYKVGKTRGDGGLGIWKDGKLFVSANWHDWKLITTGPIRSEFELTYDAWDAGGRKISETKRFSIDAGSNMSRVESIFVEATPSSQSGDEASPPRPLQIGVGLAERPGENDVVSDDSPEINSWESSIAKGLVVQNQSAGWMTYWQPVDFTKGATAVAIVLPRDSVPSFTTDKPDLPASAFAPPTHTATEGQPAVRNLLAIAPAELGKPFVYYIGAGWSESGDFPDAKSWNNYVRRFTERRDQPLQVTVGK